jgi:hypothetical protein
MRQLKERITHSFRLEPLVRGDIENYVDFRMRAAGYRGPKVFNREAIRLITRTSEGLTRRINILADKALLAAFAAGAHAVTAAEVRRAVRDSEFYRARSGAQKIRFGAVALAAGLILGWATHMLLSRGEAPRPQAAASLPPPAGPRVDTVAAPAPAAAPSLAAAPLTPSPAGTIPETERLVMRAAVTPRPTARDAPAALLAAPIPARTAAQPAAVPGRTPVAPAAGKLSRERFEATQAWLRDAPGDRYSIQLATVGAGQPQQLEDFLRRAADTVPVGELFVYSVKIDGQQHYRVAYGSFPGATGALEAMKGLPPLLAAYQPYPRSVERMRSQNRQ